MNACDGVGGMGQWPFYVYSFYVGRQRICDKTMKVYPLLVHSAFMVVRNAASVKSRYQLGVVQVKVREVPFSGAADINQI